MNYRLKDTFKHCRSKHFHSFQYRCVKDIEITNMEKNEEVISTNIIGYMEFKSQFFGLSKKIKNVRRNVLYLVKKIF